jgi:hypothetical protein
MLLRAVQRYKNILLCEIEGFREWGGRGKLSDGNANNTLKGEE